MILTFFSAALLFLFPLVFYPYFFKTLYKSIYIENLPKELEGIKILHISDTHFFGNNIKLRRYLQSLWGKKYDLIIVTGDIIDENIGIRELYHSFSGFCATYGKFYVLGNHDLFFYDERYFLSDASCSDLRLNTPLLKKKMKNMNFHLLENDSTLIHIHGIPVQIAGCSDLKSNECNIEKTCAHIDPNMFTIFLSHNPDVIKWKKVRNSDLIFAGHTHGGQIVIPFLGPIIKKSKIIKERRMSGIFKLKKGILAISNGVGFGKMHKIRLLCNPHCIVYTLKGTAA